MSVRILAAAALGLMLAACSSMLPKLEAPQLQVVKVDVLKSDFLQQELRVRMRVDNPNDRVLPCAASPMNGSGRRALRAWRVGQEF
jgi:LEA14-like dessication related protein